MESPCERNKRFDRDCSSGFFRSFSYFDRDSTAGQHQAIGVFPKACLFVAAFLSVLCSIAAADNSATDLPSPEQLQLFLDKPEQIYGSRAIYRVYRNRKPIGSHTLFFDRQPNELIVNVEAEMAVKVLGFSLFSRRYQVAEVWSAGELVLMKTSINDSREGVRTIEAQSRGDYLLIEDSARESTFTSALAEHASNHWHPGVVSARRIFHVLHGRLYQGPPQARGWERVVLDNGDVVSARRFDYLSGFTASVWYDADWRWVKLTFNADDGSTVEYKCYKCRAG